MLDLDTSGLKCPLPVLKARKALKAVAVGERLRLISTDPSALMDVPAFCKTAGHTLAEVDQQETVFIFVIEKGAQ